MPLIAPPDPFSSLSTRIHWLEQLAERHEQAYCSFEARQARQLHHAQHPTAIFALKCMDGRLNLSVATQTPPGYIQPFRNLGGMFNLGWPYLSEVLHRGIERLSRDSRQAILLITYHYSRGDPSRGCAGFAYDTNAARDHAMGILRQAKLAFGAGAGNVYPIVCGYETDEDALTLHGDTESLAIADLSPSLSYAVLDDRLRAILPLLPWGPRRDLLHLVEGNLQHIQAVRSLADASQREIAMDHREWIVGIGRGFDWLHTPNQALLIGPYSPDLAKPIRTAASIISDNMMRGRMSAEGFLLWACVPYDLPGHDRAKAVLRAEFFSDFAADEIHQFDPALASIMQQRRAVVHWPTRRVEWNPAV